MNTTLNSFNQFQTPVHASLVLGFGRRSALLFLCLIGLSSCASVTPISSFHSAESRAYCGSSLSRTNSTYSFGSNSISETDVRRLFLKTGNADLLNSFFDDTLNRSVMAFTAAACALPIALAVKSGGVSGINLVIVGSAAGIFPFAVYSAFSNPRDRAISEYNWRMAERCH